jgi:hypothetical protein
MPPPMKNVKRFYPELDILSRIEIFNSYQGISENEDRHSSLAGNSSLIDV